MKKLEFAIEIGSTNVAIYKRGNGIVLKEPCLISYKKDGKKIKVHSVGVAAKKQLGKSSIKVNFVRPVANGYIKEEKMAVLLLKELIKKVIEKTIIPNKISILFIVPNGINQEEKAKFKNIGYEVGASIVKFLPASIASLIGCGFDIGSPSPTISINIGGETLDVASIASNSMLMGYTETIGGKNIDETIKHILSEDSEHAINISMLSAETIKKEIASLYMHDKANIEVSGISNIDKVPKTIVVKSSDIYPAIEYFFKKIVGHIDNIITKSNPDVVTSIAENGIYISGGVANITGIKNYIENKTKIDARIIEQPENAAIVGAGKLLSDKNSLNEVTKEN